MNVVGLQKLHLAQIEVVAAGTLLWLLLGFVRPDLFAVFDASDSVEGHPVQVAGVQPEAAAFIAHVIGDAVILGDDLVGGHLGTAVQAFHLRTPVMLLGRASVAWNATKIRVVESRRWVMDKTGTASDSIRCRWSSLTCLGSLIGQT